MRFSRALIPTVKEAPADASNASHVLLTRAGFIRRVGAGIYDFLPLGLRSLRKVERIIREEMDRAGALEVLMPALLPAELFKETGRWDLYGDTLFRIKDRKGADHHLGPTHEEVVTDIARREIRSYRDLPKNLYQVQVKFRDEPRPRGGLLRCREFIMKDAYSFDADEEGAKKSYETMRVAYTRIFDRLKLTYRMVQADAGAIGGNTSAEFQVLVDSGEDSIVACHQCDYAANIEVATVKPLGVKPLNANAQARKKTPTPGKKSIEEVAAFLNKQPRQILKSLLFLAGGRVVMAVVRGDHEVNQIRLARELGVDEVFLASEADVEKATGAGIGFAGPIDFSGEVVVDPDASFVANAVVGANENDFHWENANYERDWQGRIAPIRLAHTDDPCPNCIGGVLKQYRGIEGGHIFILGTRYSAAMNAMYLDEQQQKKAIVMGCYGIGVSRLVATAIEQHNDENGILWPLSIAPYQVHLVTLGKEGSVAEAAEQLYADLTARGVEVLWDDRDERPGVKFKDADLIGLPMRVTIGAKGLANGNVEMKPRTETDPKKSELVALAGAAERIAGWVKQGLA